VEVRKAIFYEDRKNLEELGVKGRQVNIDI
jgi:hypothetical protein